MRRTKRLGIELVRGGLTALRQARETVSLVGMTLEEDDAKIARKWLKHREHWRDPESVSRFESAFAQWNGSAFAFAFSGGRKALSACIYALGLGQDDEVILPGYTCIVVQNAFDFAKVRTVHCDIELDSFGPDVTSVASRITPRTKAIFIQHLYGFVCRDYEALLALARRHGLQVIEDCAHATGASFRGKKIGTLGDVAFYSFEWSKVMTTIAGGVAVANDPVLGAKLAEFAARCTLPSAGAVEQHLTTAIAAYLRGRGSHQWWALPWLRFRYGAEETIGITASEVEGELRDEYFTRMSAASAELGLNQLGKIDRFNAMRRSAAILWDRWCDDHGHRKPLILPDSQPSFLRYPVLLEPEKKLATHWAREELNVELGVWFRTHLHPSPRAVENCPNADRAVAQCVNFPCLLPEWLLLEMKGSN